MKIFHLPDLGEGLAEAEIREWYVKEGETVSVDQPLVSMETAKAVVDVPSPYAGKIVQLHGKVNDIIKTHAPLISFEVAETAQTAKAASKGSVVGALEESTNRLEEEELIIGSSKKNHNAIQALPAARVLAKELNVDLAQVKGSGPRGLITPDDVKNSIAKQSNSILTGDKVSLRGVRRAMAQTMALSHREVVPVSIIEDADITGIDKADITIKLIRAMIAGIKTEPALNAWFDGQQLERKLWPEINIGLAVDSQEGLFVPVLRDVEKQSDGQLREKIDTFKKDVSARRLASTDMQGATITLSNFGTITGKYATPIIVPPMVAILGCGRMRETPLIKNGEIVIGRLLPLSLTFDHRAVTGGEATRFLGSVIQSLKNKQ